MRRGVGTVIETELALVAEVGDASEVCGVELLRFSIDRVSVEAHEKIAEGRAETVTAAAPVADVEDALELRLDLRLFPK